jgi:hypothetical protein
LAILTLTEFEGDKDVAVFGPRRIDVFVVVENKVGDIALIEEKVVSLYVSQGTTRRM